MVEWEGHSGLVIFLRTTNWMLIPINLVQFDHPIGVIIQMECTYYINVLLFWVFSLKYRELVMTLHASFPSLTVFSLVWIWLQPNSWALDSAATSCRWCLGILPCAAPINAIRLQWWLWQWQGKAIQFFVEWFTV